MFGNVENASLVAHMRSKQRQLARDIKCPQPPGSAIWPKSWKLDIYMVLQELISENPEVTRWIFKMNEFSNLNGLAYFDVDAKLVDDPTYLTLQTAHCYIAFASTTWESWEEFSHKLLKNGGVIEACAPQNLLLETRFVHLMINPDREIQIMGSNTMVYYLN
jgi:hypothetical protein